MPIARKSVKPMAAVTASAGSPRSTHHCFSLSATRRGRTPPCWPRACPRESDAKAGVSELVLPAIERSGPVEAWIIDDTGFPKKGRHSVGVTRQYCGQLGKQDNCQVAVTLSLTNHDASLPFAYRLYLPEDWAKDEVVGTRPRSRRRSLSKPNLRSPLSSLKRPGLPDYPRVWC